MAIAGKIYRALLRFFEKYYGFFFAVGVLVLAFYCFRCLDVKYVDSWDEARHGVNAYEMILEAITIAAVLSGSLFGDHCAPISDTTVMSSMAGGCNHIDHVRTQIPYALLAAVASFIAYLIVGVTQMAAGIALPVALAILVVLFLLATRLFGKKIA